MPSRRHYDEPEILRYAITSICPKDADVRHWLCARAMRPMPAPPWLPPGSAIPMSPLCCRRHADPRTSGRPLHAGLTRRGGHLCVAKQGKLDGDAGRLAMARRNRANTPAAGRKTALNGQTPCILSLPENFYNYLFAIYRAPLRIRDLTEDDWLNGLWPSAAMLAPGFPGVFRAPIELFPLQDRAQAISYSEYCHTAAARRSSWTRRRML